MLKEDKSKALIKPYENQLLENERERQSYFPTFMQKQRDGGTIPFLLLRKHCCYLTRAPIE